MVNQIGDVCKTPVGAGRLIKKIVCASDRFLAVGHGAQLRLVMCAASALAAAASASALVAAAIK